MTQLNPPLSPPRPSARHSTGLHLAAIATLLATFPLVFLGGLVTSHGSGLSVPDWPNSYGYNMWLFPPRLWSGGIFYEHTHRLLGTLVGFLAVTMVFSAFGTGASPRGRKIARTLLLVSLAITLLSLILKLTLGSALAGSDGTPLQKALPHLVTGFASLALTAGVALLCRNPEPRRWVRWLSVAVLLTVIAQGIKGGLRVELVNINLAVAHGIFGQLVFSLIALAVLVTSRWWRTYSPPSTLLPSRLPALAAIAFSLVLGQLVVAAFMRHYQAGLAIPTLPLAYGHLLPPITPADLDAANAYRLSLADPSLRDVSLLQIWLHYGHRVGAIIVSIGMISAGVYALRHAQENRWIKFLGALLLVLLTAQLTLGLATVYFRKPADIATLHQTVGAFCLVFTAILSVSAARVFQTHPTPRTATAPLPNLNTPLPA